MAGQSKVAVSNNEIWAQFWPNLLKSMLKNNTRKGILASIFVIIFILIKIRFSKSQTDKLDISKLKGKKQKGRGNVDSVFFQRIIKLIKIVIPSWKCGAIVDIVMLTVMLVLRTYLSIYLAGANGRIVKAIIKLNFGLFFKRILQLGIIALPASFVNSYLDFLNKSLGIYYRNRLTQYFTQTYLKDMIFYQLTNLDSRVQNPDQRMTADIEKWANTLSVIYSNFTKPILDITLFSRKLAELVGWRGPFLVVIWYLVSGIILRFVSPPFGKLTAISQKLEGEYRSCHTDLQHQCEEIAFYKGYEWEKLYMGSFDGMFVKYGAVLIGYAVLGMPVFGPGSKQYLERIGNDASAITRDYVRNSSLLINLAKAIGRLVISYKEIQQLAGYTTLVAEMRDVLSDLNKGKYERTQIIGQDDINNQGLERLNTVNQGKLERTENYIEFVDMPIVTPNGDKLVKSMNVNIQPGMNVVISGPNGCGKSSLFRILGGLWPIYGGTLKRPETEKLFYVPQRPYLPPGTLRDQIIYPQTKLHMIRRNIKDDEILEVCQLSYILEREGDLDTEKEWNDVLSVGEKQRLAMARLFYHRPLFAILDECTSSLSYDIEAILYEHSKKIGVTLFTVSHRTSLFKYHEFKLSFDGHGEWKFEKMVLDEVI